MYINTYNNSLKLKEGVWSTEHTISSWNYIHYTPTESRDLFEKAFETLFRKSSPSRSNIGNLKDDSGFEPLDLSASKDIYNNYYDKRIINLYTQTKIL